MPPIRVAHAAAGGPVDADGKPLPSGTSGLVLLTLAVAGGRIDALLSPLMADLVREELIGLTGQLRPPKPDAPLDEQRPEALAAALSIEGQEGRAGLVRRMIAEEVRASHVIEALLAWLGLHEIGKPRLEPEVADREGRVRWATLEAAVNLYLARRDEQNPKESEPCA